MGGSGRLHLKSYEEKKLRGAPPSDLLEIFFRHDDVIPLALGVYQLSSLKLENNNKLDDFGRNATTLGPTLHSIISICGFKRKLIFSYIFLRVL